MAAVRRHRAAPAVSSVARAVAPHLLLAIPTRMTAVAGCRRSGRAAAPADMTRRPPPLHSNRGEDSRPMRLAKDLAQAAE